MNKLTNIQGQQLINLIKDRPFLYNKADKNYKLTQLKKNTWKEISEKIGVNENYCKTAWKSLRDQFVKCNREILDDSRVECATSKIYKYYDQLSFLKQTYQTSEKPTKRCEELNEPSMTATEANSDIEMKSTFPNKAKDEPTTDVENSLQEFVFLNQKMPSTRALSNTESPSPSIVNSSNSQADIDQFFLSLSSMVKNADLTPSQTRQIQRTVLNALVDKLDSLENIHSIL